MVSRLKHDNGSFLGCIGYNRQVDSPFPFLAILLLYELGDFIQGGIHVFSLDTQQPYVLLDVPILESIVLEDINEAGLRSHSNRFPAIDLDELFDVENLCGGRVLTARPDPIFCVSCHPGHHSSVTPMTENATQSGTKFDVVVNIHYIRVWDVL
jgi:hypothetical protein